MQIPVTGVRFSRVWDRKGHLVASNLHPLKQEWYPGKESGVAVVLFDGCYDITRISVGFKIPHPVQKTAHVKLLGLYDDERQPCIVCGITARQLQGLDDAPINLKMERSFLLQKDLNALKDPRVIERVKGVRLQVRGIPHFRAYALGCEGEPLSCFLPEEVNRQWNTYAESGSHCWYPPK